MAMDIMRFNDVMAHWNTYFVQGADQPVIGASEAELRALKMPACVVPGSDKTHPKTVSENLVQLLPHGELRPLVTREFDMDVGPRDEWEEKEGELAAIFIEFMRRVAA
jgi:hypothetical protein